MKDEEKAREQHVSEPSANRQRLPASGEADLSGNRPEEDLLGAEVTTLAILNTTVDGIIIIDAGGIIQSFNPAAERIFGYAADEVIGKSVNLLMPSPYREEHDDHLRRYLTTGEKRIIGIGREVVGLRKDGTVFPMDLAVSEVRLGDRRLFTGIVRDVTERKQAEEVLKKSHRELQQTKQYLERLIESSPDAIVSTDREGSITFFSPGAEKLLGYHLEEIIGQRVTALYESEEQAKEVMSQMRSQGGTVSAFETTIRSKDGSLIPVLISASILYDEEGQEAGTVGFNKDLRERKQAEEVLRESEERFRSVAQSAIDAIISADGRGNIVSWNRGAQTIFGYTEEEVLGEPLTLLMPERYREAHQSGLERMQSTGESRVIGKTVELHGLRKDGSEFPLALSLATWQGGGGEYYSGIIRDITEQKRAEGVMRLAQERMEQQLEIARTIQQSFLPARLPGDDDPRFSLAAANASAAAVGGDYYDVIPLGHDRLGLVICDVSGKGVPGAIYMARLVSDFRFLVDPHEGAPADTLTELNRLLLDRGPPGMFVTLLYLVLNVETGVVMFANAGHLPMLVRRIGGLVEVVEGMPGPPLSIIENPAYANAEIVLAPNEDLLLFTDGVTEAMNASHELFTQKRLVRVYQSGPLSPEALVDEVVEAVKAFAGDAQAHDDLTLLVARWEGEDPLML